MKKYFLLILGLSCAGLSFAQLQYTAAKAQNVAGVYTDLGTSGSVISTANFDNANSAAQNIGFNFYFNGTVFTQFILSTNGFIKLGTTAPGTTIYQVLDSSVTNTIAPFNYDLIGALNPEYRVATSGTTGSRICTIQFKHLADKTDGTTQQQYDSINFQVKLYETSNIVEFIYGHFDPSSNTDGVVTATCGVKGSNAANSVNATKLSTLAWASASFINGNYTASFFNNRRTVLPTQGITLRFTPVNDISVAAVYTLAKIPKPFGVYNHVVSAKVKNLGATGYIGYPVTLNFTGANTITTIKSIDLAPKDSLTVEFDPVSPWNGGANTVTVSVPSDDLNTNNSANYSQNVNDSAFNYADASAPVGRTGFNTSEGIVFTKFPISGSDVMVTAVKVYISSDPNNIGQLVSAVAWDNWNNIYRYSAESAILVSDTAKYKRFVFTNPLTFPSYSDIYVGLKQKVNVLGFNPVAYQKEGPPGRTDVFYKDAPPYGSLDDFISGRLMMEAIVKKVSFDYSYSEQMLAVWNFAEMNSPASAPAQSFHRNLVSSNLLTRGPDAPSSPGNDAFFTTGFQNNGISTSNTDYFQFEIGANATDTLSLSSIDFGDLTGDSSFFDPNDVNVQLAYSLNAINFTLIGTPINVYNGGSATFDVSGISALQNILNGNKVTFRFYASGNNTTGAFGFKPRYEDERNITVYGIIRSNVIIADQVIPAGADFYLPTCTSTATGSIGFTSTGTYAPGNVYVAKINTTLWARDTAAVVIGTLASTANSGTINFTIPAGIDKRLWGHHEGYIDIWIESTSNPSARSIPSPEFRLTMGEQCYGTYSDFRSKQSGNWTTLSTWEMSSDGDNWVASTFIPDQRADNVRIMPADSVTITTPVNLRSITVSGKLAILNGGANNGSITFYLKEIGGFLHDGYQYCMQIDSAAVLKVTSATLGFDSVIKVSSSYSRGEKRLIKNFGKITIGDGTSSNGMEFYKFGTDAFKRYRFYDESIFEWNSTSINGPVSNLEYFKLAPGHPILKLTKMPAASFGSSVNTIVNAVLEINTPVTMAGSGFKQFSDGITGSSILNQAPGSGEFRTVAAYEELPQTDTSGGVIGILSGHLTVNLSNGGLVLKNGARVIDNGDILITGSGVSLGRIEVVPTGRMTLDAASVLTIENADLLNEGTIDGPGKIQFTGADTSHLKSTGIINAKLELSAKQLRLISNSTTSSIDLLGGSHLRLDSFQLNMRTGNLVGDATNFIVTNDTGRLSRYVPSDQFSETSFNVGIDENSYTPVTITNAGLADNFMVRVTKGIFKDSAITHKNVNRTWFVKDQQPGGGGVTLKMQWKQADEQPEFLRDQSYISRRSVCPLPRNCSGSFFDASDAGSSISLGDENYSRSRSSIDSFRTDTFIVTSKPFVYTFNGNGNWSDSINWTPGIPAPYIIKAGMEVIINPSGISPEPDVCISNSDIQIIEPGKLTVLPQKKLKIMHPNGGKVINRKKK